MNTPLAGRRRLSHFALGLAAGAGVLALAAGPAEAQVCYPPGSAACSTTTTAAVTVVVGVSDDTVVPGQQIQVTAEGFLLGSTVTITIESVEQTIGSAIVDAQGGVDTRVSIPTNMENGQHTLRVKGTGTNGLPRVVSRVITLSGSTVNTPVANVIPNRAATGTGAATGSAATPRSSTSSGLAKTGVYAVPAAVAGFGLLGAGVMVSRSAKKRKTAAAAA